MDGYLLKCFRVPVLVRGLQHAGYYNKLHCIETVEWGWHFQDGISNSKLQRIGKLQPYRDEASYHHRKNKQQQHRILFIWHKVGAPVKLSFGINLFRKDPWLVALDFAALIFFALSDFCMICPVMETIECGCSHKFQKQVCTLPLLLFGFHATGV